MSPESDARWWARARLALASRGVNKDLADTKLDDADRHCTESGQRPEDVFGTPEDFAAAVVAERGPVHPDDDFLSAIIVNFGLLGLVFGAVAWLGSGLLTSVSTASLVGSVLLLCVIAGAQVPQFLAQKGKPRAVPWGLGGVLALVLLTASAFQLLPRQPLFAFPAPLLILLGFGLLGWGIQRHRPTRAKRSTRDAEQWLRELAGLLEGRHDLPRERAAELAADAAAHLADTGRTPGDEFGEVEDYALRLAEHEPRRPPWWRRPRTVNGLGSFLLVVLLTINFMEGGSWWLTGLGMVALVGNLWTHASKPAHGSAGG